MLPFPFSYSLGFFIHSVAIVFRLFRSITILQGRSFKKNVGKLYWNKKLCTEWNKININSSLVYTSTVLHTHHVTTLRLISAPSLLQSTDSPLTWQASIISADLSEDFSTEE